MKTIINSICKNLFRNIIYIILLLTAFIPINLFVNAYLMGRKLMFTFAEFRQFVNNNGLNDEYTELFEIQKMIQLSISSILVTTTLVTLLCTLVLPFLQYMLSLGRGYEIGVMRLLGMGKGRAWVRLLIENLFLIGFALIVSTCTTVIFHKQFAFSLFGVDIEIEQIIIETLGENDLFYFNWQTFLYILSTAVIITLISSALSNVLISNSEPLKLIRNYK